MAIHINDPETEVRVRTLAEKRGTSLTQAISHAVAEALTRDGIRLPTLPQMKSKLTGDSALMEQLDLRLRYTTLQYTRLRNATYGSRGGGSRVYQMLAKHGPVEALRRLVMRPTEGLKFLDENDALDLAAERIALDPRFKAIIPDDIRIRARANLAVIGR